MQGASLSVCLSAFFRTLTLSHSHNLTSSFYNQAEGNPNQENLRASVKVSVYIYICMCVWVIIIVVVVVVVIVVGDAVVVVFVFVSEFWWFLIANFLEMLTFFGIIFKMKCLSNILQMMKKKKVSISGECTDT